MDSRSVSESFRLNFIKDEIRKFFLYSWVYKEEVCVLDFDIDGRAFAFDVTVSENLLNIKFVERSSGDEPKEIDGFNDLSFDDALIKIKEKVLMVEAEVKANYGFFVSVIIPVYNREHMIERCIKSFNNQTIDKSLYEVIFVDDYSKDNSVKFIEENISKDVNYKILKRPINSGSASAPRNDGMKAARGRYFLFIDSDDFVFDYCLQDLYECAERNNPDMVYLKIDGDKGRPFGKKPFQYGNIDNASISDNHLTRSLMPSKMVKSSVINKSGIHFPVDIKVGEDRVFIIHALSKSKKISVLADKPYYYLTNHSDGRLSHVPQGLDKDFEIVSRTLKHIYLSDKSAAEKSAFYSIWMNSVIESYLIARVKNKKHKMSDRKAYVDMIIRENNIYKEIHSETHVYDGLKEFYSSLISCDSEKIISMCLEEK